MPRPFIPYLPDAAPAFSAALNVAILLHWMKKVKRLAFFIGLLLSHLLLPAQEYIAKIEHFSVEQGLSHRQVSAIFQDSKGFVWLGTPNGLNRFDGYSFRVYTKEKDGLLFNDIQWISEDASGFLWLVARETGQVCLFQPESGEVLTLEKSFGTQYPDFAATHFNGPMLADEEGALWMTAADAGALYRYHPQSGVQRFKVEGCHYIHLAYYNPDKTFWAWAADDVLIQLSREGKLLQRIEKAWLWGVSENGILASSTAQSPREEFLYCNLKGQPLRYKPPGLLSGQGPHPALVLPFDTNGTFLIHDQLLNTKGETLAQWEFAQHERNNFVWRSFYKDHSGRFWLGDDFGFYILQIKRNRFQHYFYKKGARPGMGNSIRGILATAGKVYANLDHKGLFEQELRSGESQIVKAVGTDWGNYGLTINQMGQIWSGRQKAISCWFPGAAKAETIPVNFDPWSFCEDKQGNVWFGSESGLYLLEAGAATPKPLDRYNAFPELAGALVLHIEQDSLGFLWICANNGFYKVSPQNGVVARYWSGGSGPNFLPAENFLHFHLDASGIFWFATANGLLRVASQTSVDGSRVPNWNEHTGKWYNRDNGLPNDFIYAVYEDGQGKLWLPSDQGIIRLDKKTEEIRAYFEADGITNPEFNRKAHFQAPNGMLYFGGLNGVNGFNPADFDNASDAQAEAPLVLTAFHQFDGTTQQLADHTAELLRTYKIMLSPDERFFNLEIALLSFDQPHLIQYAWKIEGMEERWHFQKERQFNFGGLPYGEWVLRIRAQAADGQWAKKELTFNIKVLRPWYLRAWFLVLTILLLGTGISAYIRRRSQQHILEQKKLEGMVAKATERIEEDKRTIEKQTEELRHLDRVKSNFFANVSHELRTPLSLLLGPIGTVLKRNKIDNQDFTLIKLAQVHARQLLQLVNQILDLSKVESGKLVLHESPVLLYPLLRRIVAAFESHADQRGIRFLFQFNARKELRILLDANKLETILNNLLSNALKFTPSAAGKSVGLSVENRGHSLLLIVSDTGRGIHPDDLPHVFNRFYQSAQPNAPVEGGTGIGLALCKELVELMEGRIWAESPELGEGVRFFVEIPQKEVLGVVKDVEFESAETGEQRPEALHTLPNHGEPSENMILVVEDNKSLRDYVRLILSGQYQVLIAENGEQALKILSETTVQLLISDIMMPVMDGFELLENLKKEARFRLLPVILLTARAEVQDQLRALRIGVDDYLLKPFEEEELLARVAALLERHHERERWRAEVLLPEPEGSAATPQEPTAPEPSAVEMAWLEELESLMQQELQNDQISVTWLATHLYLSERQLQRRINRLTGLSPNAYIREMRLQQARRLLEARQVHAVKEAAWAVGLRDEKHFSQIFRERFGKSAADFLR